MWIVCDPPYNRSLTLEFILSSIGGPPEHISESNLARGNLICPHCITHGGGTLCAGVLPSTQPASHCCPSTAPILPVSVSGHSFMVQFRFLEGVHHQITCLGIFSLLVDAFEDMLTLLDNLPQSQDTVITTLLDNLTQSQDTVMRTLLVNLPQSQDTVMRCYFLTVCQPFSVIHVLINVSNYHCQVLRLPGS